MDKKVVDVIGQNELNIQSLLLKGIELYKVEEELSNILFQGKVKINVCNDNKLLYFVIDHQIFIYSKKELSEGFVSELKTEPLPAKAGRFELLLKQPKVVSAQGY